MSKNFQFESEINSNSIESNFDDFYSIFAKIFANSSNNAYHDNIEEEDKNRFYNKESTNTKENSVNGTNAHCSILPVLFMVSKEESIDLIGKKRGRKTPEDEDEIENENKINNRKKKHDKYDIDNILTKIQVNYMTFIINFVNYILDFLNHNKNERFKQIDYKIKQKLNQKVFNNLKLKKLQDIVCLKISPKNKKIINQDTDFNKNLYINLKKIPIINKILEENYLKFFRNIYYKSEKTISLKPYGIDTNITLSDNIKTFNDKINFKDKDYIEAIQKCVNNNYFEKKIVFDLKK